VNFQPSTFNRKLRTVNFQPSTFNRKLRTVNFQPSTFNPELRTVNFQLLNRIHKCLFYFAENEEAQKEHYRYETGAV
jgi:hypothetical protein